MKPVGWTLVHKEDNASRTGIEEADVNDDALVVSVE